MVGLPDRLMWLSHVILKCRCATCCFEEELKESMNLRNDSGSLNEKVLLRHSIVFASA